MNKPGEFSVATLYEASSEARLLPGRIKPVDAKMKLWGPVFTVRLDEGNNYYLHHAIYNAPPDSVIVAEVDGSGEFGYWGEIMSHAAKKKRIKGLVIDGCIRDSREIRRLNFPVFCTGYCVRSTSKLKNLTKRTGITLTIGRTIINPNDWIIGDADGVLVISNDKLNKTIVNAAKREQREKQIIKSIESGKTTIEIYKLNNEKVSQDFS